MIIMTDEEYAAQDAVPKVIHPLCHMLRELRRQSGLSLAQIQARTGMSAVVLGAYERGDREPPMRKLEAALDIYGYKLMAVPADEDAIQLPNNMVAQLRSIAAQIEARAHDVVS